MANAPITQPTDADVDAFLAQVEPEQRRRDATRVSAMMQRVTGQPPVLWGTSIIGFGSTRYQYASGGTGDWPPVAMSPRKAALTLYVLDGTGTHADALAALGPHATGKGCLYTKRLDAVDKQVLEGIIRTTWTTTTTTTEQPTT